MENESQTRREQKVLVEEIGLYFEETYGFSPLMARIHVLLILCPYSGYTFDEIVKYTCSSKSSVSTNLNMLIEKGNIEYFTKSGDRKRYFRNSKSSWKVDLINQAEEVERGLKISQKIGEFNQKHNKEKHSKNKEIGKLYRTYLEMHHQNLKKIIKKMNQLEKTV